MNRVMEALKELYDAAVLVEDSPIENVSVYYGDPIQIPEDSLPAIAIQPISTNYIMRGSRYDQKECNIEIRLIYNQKSFYKTTPTIAKKVYAVETVINQVEKTDADGETMANTICGVIQRNMTLPYLDGSTARNASELAYINNVSYIFNESRGFPSYEVVISMTAIVIGNRD